MPRNSASGGLATTMSDRATFERRNHAARAGLITRERLVSRLLGAADAPIASVVAPAGYGKTTILSEWDAADQRPFAWIALDDRHNDPALLVASIARGLDGIEAIDPGSSTRSRLRAPASRMSSFRDWFNRLASVNGHSSWCSTTSTRCTSRRRSNPLIAMAQHLPPRSQLALAARSEPPMRFAAYGHTAGWSSFTPTTW